MLADAQPLIMPPPPKSALGSHPSLQQGVGFPARPGKQAAKPADRETSRRKPPPRLDFGLVSWRDRVPDRNAIERGGMEDLMARANGIREIWTSGKAVV